MIRAVFTHVLLAGVVLMGVVFHARLAMAAQVGIVEGRYAGEKYVSISGPISIGDFDKVQSAARVVIREGGSPLVLLLNSEGGDVVEAMKIGMLARELLAKTYVYGNTLYVSGSPEGNQLEGYVDEDPLMGFGLRAASADRLNEQDIVRCYSACVIIFYGGVSRHASDNNDYRSGFKSGREIPVIGIHRPYYEAAGYSELSPSEARIKYQRLEVAVRTYLLEMGAPVAIIDRMFRKASSDVELVPSEEFKGFYQAEEPFIEEWLIAKCGIYGPRAALTGQEQDEYEGYRQSLKRAIDAGKVRSVDEYNKFSHPEVAHEYIAQLEEKIHVFNAGVMKCRETAVGDHQAAWASVGE